MTTDNKVGRPRIEISDEDFAKMVRMVEVCCTQDEICSIFGITEPTLDTRLKERGYSNFLDFYKKHSSEGKQSLRRLQWAAAQEGNTSMLIWLGKQWLGQSDKQMVDTTHTITSFEVVADEDQG
jgi:hypothetical protein